MSPQEVIITPIVSEKALTNITREDNQAGKYAFYVHPNANRTQVKDALEILFDVDVTKINILNVRGKDKTLGRFRGTTAARKKAIVTLKAGQRIQQLEGLGG
jgi:large subunit ribosomal protein L23